MKKKILIYNSGGGLGDSIRIFSLINGLQRYFSDAKIFYLGAHDNHFLGKLKEYNIHIESFNLGIEYFGFRWWHFFKVIEKLSNLKFDKFDYIIDLQSKIRNTIILKQIPTVNFYSSTFNFFFCTSKKLKSFLINGFEFKKYDIKNINNKFFTEALRLLPNNNYIGFSVTQGNTYRKKSWPINNFISLAKEVVKKKKKPVFLINKNNIELINLIKKEIPEALFPELSTEMDCPALVTALATRLEKAVSIDNGIMHMIALANIPMIVLFGPTNSIKFSPDVDKIKVLDSKILYSSPDISKITINDVFKIL